MQNAEIGTVPYFCILHFHFVFIVRSRLNYPGE